MPDVKLLNKSAYSVPFREQFSIPKLEYSLVENLTMTSGAVDPDGSENIFS
jgi:hypothetical protein